MTGNASERRKLKAGKKSKRCLSVRGYRPPKGEMARLPIKSNGIVKKERKMSIIELEARRNKTPAPSAYANARHIVWSSKNMSNKGVAKFSRTKRVSIT